MVERGVHTSSVGSSRVRNGAMKGKENHKTFSEKC